MPITCANLRVMIVKLINYHFTKLCATLFYVHFSTYLKLTGYVNIQECVIFVSDMTLKLAVQLMVNEWWNNWVYLLDPRHSSKIVSLKNRLTDCVLVTPYGDIELGQPGLRYWLIAWRHQGITWTNVNLSWVRSIYIHLAAISFTDQPPITKKYLKTTPLKFHVCSAEISLKSLTAKGIGEQYVSCHRSQRCPSSWLSTSICTVIKYQS